MVEYEFGSPPVERSVAGEGTPTYDTGTTTVGIVAGDGVVLATDRRASLGGRFVANKNTVKVERVHPTAAVTIAGSVGGAQAYVRQLRAEGNLYGTRRGETLRMDALATLAGNLLRGLPVSILLGGVGEEGPRLFSVDGAGGVLEDTYSASGSGMQIATGVLEDAFDPDGSVEDARNAAIDAVAAASERDTASGNGVNVAVVTGDGVEIEEFEDVEAARTSGDDSAADGKEDGDKSESESEGEPGDENEEAR
jgi:proteasome beta subunit